MEHPVRLSELVARTEHGAISGQSRKSVRGVPNYRSIQRQQPARTASPPPRMLRTQTFSTWIQRQERCWLSSDYAQVAISYGTAIQVQLRIVLCAHDSNASLIPLDQRHSCAWCRAYLLGILRMDEARHGNGLTSRLQESIMALTGL
eukprot:4236849-Pleurochrysis_carterae.AAC.8